MITDTSTEPLTLYRELPEYALPAEPLEVAMIGAGHRSSKIYLPLLDYIKPWVKLTAVCDPVREHADRWAKVSGARAFYSIHELVQARPMEAAIVVTPIESHHSISMYLSQHKVHHHVETSWASMFCQAKQMCAAARAQGVITRVAENFLRLPADRFAQMVARSGYLGQIGRIFCYNEHTGFHNNSRWLAFAGTYPQWVQALEHEMAHPAFYHSPERFKDSESFRARFFHFPNLGVMDMASGHGKGLMGRQSRPGHTEWHGSLGALVYASAGATWAEDLRFELRRMSPAQLAPAQQASGQLSEGGRADWVNPVHMQGKVGESVRLWSDTPLGRLEGVIPFCPGSRDEPNQPDIHAAFPVMDHIIDFVLAVKGLRQSEFTDEDALMSEMMEIGAYESVLQEGRRIKLPLEGDIQADAVIGAQLRSKYGVDPMDVQAMLNISYPKP